MRQPLKQMFTIFLATLLVMSCFQMFDPPTTTLVKYSANSNKTWKAVLLENDGNATTGRSLQVLLVDYTYKFTGFELGNVFVVDRNHGEAGLDSTSINLAWLTKDTLQIDYDKELRTFIQEKFLNGVTIIYKVR